jgi:hypothetical protein
VGAAVLREVDQLDGREREREDRSLDIITGTDDGEHGAVVVGVGMHVDEPRAAALCGGAETADEGDVTAFADVGHALEERPRRPHR